VLATLRVLVIPNADVFDPADVTLLQTWIDGGGRLIITGDTGKYLGESGNFELNSGGLAIGSLTNHANVVYISNNIGQDYYHAYENRPASLSLFSTAMNNVLNGTTTALKTTDTSSRTGITLYEDTAADRFFIDVNNFNIDNSTFVVTPTGAMFVEALLPVSMRGKALSASVVSPQATAPAVTLVEASDSDHVKISLSSVDYYAGVVITLSPCRWADAGVSGRWHEAGNWLSAAVPSAADDASWIYDNSNPVITIDAPAEALSFTASPVEFHGSANGVYGLKIVNGGRLDVGGALDLWADGWWGSRLTIINTNEAAAADIVNADSIRVRDMMIDTDAYDKSYFTHESGTLEVMVQIELGAWPTAGDEAIFRQSGGSVRSAMDTDFGLEIGENAVGQGAYIFDGGTCSFAVVKFAHTNSVFEFNNGTFQSEARDVLWKGTGTLQLAGSGTHIFDVASGRTMTLESTVLLADKPGESGSLVKTGTGTLALNAVPQISGSIDLQAGTLALNYTGTNAISALSFDSGATWADTGVWGATGSGVEHESARLSGAGSLRVVGRVPPDSWAEIHFTVAEINAGLAMGGLDSDGDGLSNFAEYALGGNPKAADAAALLPVGEVASNGLTYVYNRRINAASLGLTYGLAYDLDLVDTNDWIYAGAAWETDTGVINAEMESVTNRVDVSTLDQVFLRLEIQAD